MSFVSSRDFVLVLCSILLVLLFALTALVSRLYHKKIHTLADQWFALGEAAFKAGDPSAALLDYRNALVYSPTNSIFELHLAQALAASGRGEEAQPYLLNLLAASPGRGDINLELARIAVRQRKLNQALLYYHSAIYGLWESDPMDMRWRVRRELCEYLLDHHDLTDAQPELIALSKDIPLADSESHYQAATLAMRADMWQLALENFRLAQSAGPKQQDALVGLAQAEFGLNDYAQAYEILGRLSLRKRSDPAVADLLKKTGQIVDADPFALHLRPADRAKRVSNAFAAVDARIVSCAQEHGQSLTAHPPTSTLQILYAERQTTLKSFDELNLARHPDRIDPAMSLVFKMESVATGFCGDPADPENQALQRIALNHASPVGAAQ